MKYDFVGNAEYSNLLSYRPGFGSAYQTRTRNAIYAVNVAVAITLDRIGMLPVTNMLRIIRLETAAASPASWGCRRFVNR